MERKYGRLIALVLALFVAVGALASYATAEEPATPEWPGYGPDVYTYRDTKPTIQSGVETVLSWQVVGGPSPEMWVVPSEIQTPSSGVFANGTYEVVLTVRWGKNGSGTRRVAIQESNSDGGWDNRAIVSQRAVPDGQTCQTVSAVFSINPGDRVRAVALQTSGGPLQMTIGPQGIKLRVKYLSPRMY